MSWPCSGSPFHSRSSNQHGRRGGGFFGEQYRSDPWRDPENVAKPNDSIHWDNSHSQVQEQVDHWAKFIEAIGRAGKRKSSPDSRYRPQEGVQDFEEKAPLSPRRLHKERLTSPQALHYGAETQRFQSPGRRRNEHHSRGPRSQEKRDNRMEHGYHDEEREERNSYSERSQKSDYRDHPQPKRFRPLDPQEHYSESHGGFNPYHAPVVVEHDHGIQKHDESNRDHSRRQDLVQNREHGRIRGLSRSRDPDMNRGHPRSHGPDMNRGPSQSRDPHMNRGPSQSRDPHMNRGPSQSRDPHMNRGPSRSRDPDMNRGPSRSRDPDMNRGPSRSRDPDMNRGHPRSRDPDMNRGHPRSHGPDMNRGPSQSRDPDMNRGPPRSHGPDMNRGPPRSHGPDMNRGPSMSRDPDMNRGHQRSRDPDMNRGHLRNQEPGMNRAHSRTRDPGVSQEHQRSRSLPRSSDIVMNHEHSRNRNSHRTNDLPRNNLKGNKPEMDRHLSRTREPLRNREPLGHTGETDHHAEMLHDRHGSPTPYYLGKKATFHASTVERGSPMRGMSQHRKHPRMGSHPRQPHGHVEMEPNRNADLRKDDLRTRARDRDWDTEIQPGRNHGGMREQGKAFRRNDQRGTPKIPGDRADFMEHETLKIKVDMSRPVGQSSHLGYSSERQLSLDLVNVGRQRLDFLPMLEHSGTYKETAMHSGTFAQEMITLVHHVKENYFQGQGITLNDRFSDGQSYSIVDEDELEEENLEELEDMEPVINRPFGSTSNTQIFCKVGPSQRRPQAPAPGDLRLDLERKRLQKLEAVKITIAGNTQAQDSQAYVSEEDSFEDGPDSGWSEQVPQSTNEWDHPPSPKRSGPNFSARRNVNCFGNRPGPRRRQNPNSNRGARW